MIRHDPLILGDLLWVPSPYQEDDLNPMSQFQGARSSELLHVETFMCFALADPFPEEEEENTGIVWKMGKREAVRLQ